MSKKPILLSGIKPTNHITLGNYLGALKNWVALQNDFQCYFLAVDLHSMTVPHVPEELRENTLFAVATYIAAGIDPDECHLFIQSHVHQHAEMAWALTCASHMGELTRMTQYKDKSQKAGANIPVGLFAYPVLMAADVLLYGADQVPVGEDQKQHLELTRDLAQRVNFRYGEDTLVVPQPHIAGPGARVMDLQEPTKKMSKSGEHDGGIIFLSDSARVVEKKFKRAVTDSDTEIRFSNEKPGISNLLSIQAALLDTQPQVLQERYVGKLYGHLKMDTAALVIETLEPMQKKTAELLQDKGELGRILSLGAEKARDRAQDTLKRFYDRLGLVPKY